MDIYEQLNIILIIIFVIEIIFVIVLVILIIKSASIKEAIDKRRKNKKDGK